MNHVFARLAQWWHGPRWQMPDVTLLESYRATFGGEHGRIVLNDLIVSVYATVCNSNDPFELAAHNARRKVVHEILRGIDIAEHPEKYNIDVQSEQEGLNSYGVV